MLTFNLECTIAFGAAPLTCAARNRDNEDEGDVVSLSYQVTAGDSGFDNIDGVAVERSESDDSETSSVSIGHAFRLVVSFLTECVLQTNHKRYRKRT